MRGLAAAGGEYGVADAIATLEDAMVLKSQNLQPLRFQVCRPPGIAGECKIIIVRCTIDLDDQSCFDA